MLRSLSSRLLGNPRSAGLMLGRNRVGFALFDGTGQRLARLDVRTLDVPLFTGRPSEAAAAALVEALHELAPDAARGYLPLHVSLPGAAVQMAVLPLEVLPKKRAVRLDLARWHFTQAGNVEQALACDCESLGMDGDKHLLLAVAMDQAWHACIIDALARAGVTAWSLNADVCRQFNRFHDRFCADKQGGALFAVTEDAWSLLLWDELRRVRYCSSRWRSSDASEGVRIAAEVERRILACVQSLPGLRIEHLYAVADGHDAGLVDAIDARLREPCIRLCPEADGEPGSAESAACRFAPIAAALQS